MVCILLSTYSHMHTPVMCDHTTAKLCARKDSVHCTAVWRHVLLVPSLVCSNPRCRCVVCFLCSFTVALIRILTPSVLFHCVRRVCCCCFGTQPTLHVLPVTSWQCAHSTSWVKLSVGRVLVNNDLTGRAVGLFAALFVVLVVSLAGWLAGWLFVWWER